MIRKSALSVLLVTIYMVRPDRMPQPGKSCQTRPNDGFAVGTSLTPMSLDGRLETVVAGGDRQRVLPTLS
jgi:hypothetical protein